jgi:PAS domain S-box-containing protein
MSAEQGHFDCFEYGGSMSTNFTGPVDSMQSIESVDCMEPLVWELRRTQLAVRTEDTKFRSVVEMAPDAMIVFDRDGFITLVNRQTEALFGYGRDVLLGQPIELLVTEGSQQIRPSHRQWYALDSYLRPLDSQMVLCGRRADGTEFPVEIHLGPASIDGDSQVIATCCDTSESTRRGQMAREQAERLARTFEAMSEAVYIYDQSGRLIQMNAAARSLVENDFDQPSLRRAPSRGRLRQGQTRTWKCPAISSEDWPIRRILQGEIITTSAPVELHFTTLAGHERIASVTGGPLRGANGEVVGAVLVRRDVTEQRRLEQELAARAHEIESIFETDTDAVMLFDSAGRIRRLNSAMTRLLGFDMTDQAGYLLPGERSCRLAFSDLEGQPLPREAWPLYRVLRGETLTGSQAVEMRLRLQDGREIEVSISGAPIVNERGEIIGGVTATRDVTAQRQAEKQRTDILRVVAHDLASPVAALKMYLQSQQRYLERGQDCTPTPSMMTSMLQSIARMERLMEDMRVVVGLEAHELSLDCRPCDLAALCRQEAETLRIATKREVRLELPVGPVMVNVDQHRIGQVLANLLSNADKYSPFERPVTLSLRLEPAKTGKRTTRKQGEGRALQAKVQVCDRGPGIQPQEQEHLWERFRRVAGVHARPGATGSLGLGLYISHEIVERHHGTIGVRSTPGRGSTFWFTLPALATPGRA